MGLSEQIRNFLTGIHLADLLNNPDLIGVAMQQDRALHESRERDGAGHLRGAGLRHKG